MSAVIDTHAALWYLGDTQNLSRKVLDLIDGAAARGVPTYLSAISLIEVVYLAERGRIAAGAYDKLVHEIEFGGGVFAIAPVDVHVAEAMKRIPRDAVPDMPDRIIAATALHLKLPLVTRDRRLQSTGIETIW